MQASLIRLFSLLALFALCSALPKYRQAVPNPDAHKDSNSGLRCPQLGHENCATGKETLNQFGKDFAAAKYKWNKEFCEKDSDGDGVSNGAELGDPCCEFTVGGAAARKTDLSHPGEKDSMPKTESNRACNKPKTSSTPKTSRAPRTSRTPISTPVTNNTAPKPICFPASAQVTLQSGIQLTMEQLSVGDRVMVAQGKYSEVFMFTHALRDVRHQFVSLHTASGNVVDLTSGHYIYASGNLVRAADVETGAILTLADGSTSAVVKIETVTKRGLFNPQTVHGDIVVDGVVSSTYTEFISSSVAHALLSPLRAVYISFGLYVSALERGLESYMS